MSLRNNCARCMFWDAQKDHRQNMINEKKAFSVDMRYCCRHAPTQQNRWIETYWFNFCGDFEQSDEIAPYQPPVTEEQTRQMEI